jgi:hypothetical protein
LYEDALRRRPGKPERDYLKIVLLTKPPFDFQYDGVLERILDEYPTIEKLADYLVQISTGKSETHDPEFIARWSQQMWIARERNLSMEYTKEKLKQRNEEFFRQFWSN